MLFCDETVLSRERMYVNVYLLSVKTCIKKLLTGFKHLGFQHLSLLMLILFLSTIHPACNAIHLTFGFLDVFLVYL